MRSTKKQRKGNNTLTIADFRKRDQFNCGVNDDNLICLEFNSPTMRRFVGGWRKATHRENQNSRPDAYKHEARKNERDERRRDRERKRAKVTERKMFESFFTVS